MSDNVGLSTPRGSGTSGYVQRNLAYIRPSDLPRTNKGHIPTPHRQRQPDQAILDHDRKRQVEVEVFELRDQLEEQGIEEEEIEAKCDDLRRKLLDQMSSRSGPSPTKRTFKEHQVHDMAEAKIKETERLRKALKISDDYEEGGYLKRQEERAKKGEVK